MVAALTRTEQKRVEAYDVLSAQQIEAANRQTDLSAPNMVELYRIMHAADMDAIAELHRDIGVLRSVRERFAGDDWIEQMTAYLIKVDRFMIENILQEVEDQRELTKELERISGR